MLSLIIYQYKRLALFSVVDCFSDTVIVLRVMAKLSLDYVFVQNAVV